MKQKHVVYFFMFVYLLALSPKLFAQDLVPATSEDMEEFDRQVAKQLERRKQAGPSALGKQIADEAKKLKDAAPEDRKAFGKWVSSQRKKTDQGRPSSAGSLGSQQNSRRMDGEKGKKKSK